MFVQYYLMAYLKLLLLLIAVIDVQCSQTCGGRYKSKVVGGHDVGGYVYPWFVALQKRDFVHCAGSLISQNVVISAAHCFRDREAVYKVKLGVYDICKGGKQERTFDIGKYYIHEKYETPKKYFYDISLLIIIGNTNEYEPVCIPNKVLNSEARGTKGLIIGLGKTELQRRYDPDQNKRNRKVCKLREAEVKLHGNNECRSLLIKNGWYKRKESDNVICAGFLEGGISACRGDGGGPLVAIDKNGKYFLLGIISFGKGCARPGQPKFNTDVSRFIPWIQKKTGLGLKKSLAVTRFKPKYTDNYDSFESAHSYDPYNSYHD